MKMTYFSYIIKKYRIIAGKPVHVILDIMIKLLREPSLYCRNALQAIYMELSDVLDGNDRYAREILQYRIDLKNARREHYSAFLFLAVVVGASTLYRTTLRGALRSVIGGMDAELEQCGIQCQAIQEEFCKEVPDGQAVIEFQEEAHEAQG